MNCPTCSGTGIQSLDWGRVRPCPKCNKTGRIPDICSSWTIGKLDRVCLNVHDILSVLGNRWEYLEWKQRFKPGASENTAARAWERLKKDLLDLGVEFTLLEQEDNPAWGKTVLKGRRAVQLLPGVIDYLRTIIGYDYMEVE